MTVQFNGASDTNSADDGREPRLHHRRSASPDGGGVAYSAALAGRPRRACGMFRGWGRFCGNADSTKNGRREFPPSGSRSTDTWVGLPYVAQAQQPCRKNYLRL
jgi:hypothetical protein